MHGLFRTSGAFLLAAAALLLAYTVSEPFLLPHGVPDSEAALKPAWSVVNGLELGAVLLLLLALPAVHFAQAAQARRYGVIALVGAQLGLACFAGMLFINTFMFPYLATSAPTLLEGDPHASVIVGYALGTVGPAVGLLLLALAVWRAKVFPRWTAIALALGVVIGALGLDVSLDFVALAAACIGVGLQLLRGQAARPT